MILKEQYSSTRLVKIKTFNIASIGTMRCKNSCSLQMGVLGV